MIGRLLVGTAHMNRGYDESRGLVSDNPFLEVQYI